MKYWITRFSHPLRGLLFAVKNDLAIQIDLGLGIIGIPAVSLLVGGLSTNELLLLVFCWFFVVVAELQNTAIETALDQVHPEHHEAIGRSKDMTAAAVVWAGVFGLICVVLVINGKI
ncbi:MAG: undecaprenol kinase [Parcubacteria group bacterium]|nr:undecaprenol kinase [Parcubacteria group bacterium]